MRCWRAAVAALVLAGCGTPAKPPPEPPIEPEGRHITDVALGDELSAAAPATSVDRTEWPRLVLRDALPRESTLTVLGVYGARTDDVLARQVPQAERILASAGGDAKVATVMVGIHELSTGSTPGDAAARVGQIVARLRAAGAVVVVVPVPETQALGPVAGSGTAGAAYDAALADVVPSAGGTLADAAAVSTVTVIGDDLAVTPAGAARIAAVVGPLVRTAAGR